MTASKLKYGRSLMLFIFWVCVTICSTLASPESEDIKLQRAIFFEKLKFTSDYAKEVRKATCARVQSAGLLAIDIEYTDGSKWTKFLDEPWELCRNKPGQRRRLLQPYFEREKSFLQQVQKYWSINNRKEIVPVVKAKWWLESEAAGKRASRQVPFSTSLGSDLFCLYALNLGTAVHLLTKYEVDSAKLSERELRPVACENFKRVFKPELMMIPDGQDNCASSRSARGGGEDSGHHLYSANVKGLFASGILACSDFWNEVSNKLRGKIIVSIPYVSNVLFTTHRRLLSRGYTSTMIPRDLGLSSELYFWSGKDWQQLNDEKEPTFEAYPFKPLAE